MTESPGSRTSARVAAWLAVLGLPLSLFHGVGGLLGLAAVAIASPMLKRRTDDRRAFATVLLGFCSMLLGSCISVCHLAKVGCQGSPSPSASPSQWARSDTALGRNNWDTCRAPKEPCRDIFRFF